MASSTSSPIVFSGLLVLGAAFALPRAGHGAPPPDVAACIASFEAGQHARAAGSWLGARTQFRQCAETRCPAAIRKECNDAAADLSARLPTLVVEVKDPRGEDVSVGTLRVDGTVVADPPNGLAIEVDPGTHQLRYEGPGEPPRSSTVVAREGQKGRLVALPPPSRGAPPAAPTVRRSKGPPTISWVLGSVAVAALGTGAALGISGLAARADLDGCAPRCDPADVSSARTRIIASDIVVGSGLLALVVSGIFWIQAATQAAAPALSVREGRLRF